MWRRESYAYYKCKDCGWTFNTPKPKLVNVEKCKWKFSCKNKKCQSTRLEVVKPFKEK